MIAVEQRAVDAVVIPVVWRDLYGPQIRAAAKHVALHGPEAGGQMHVREGGAADEGALLDPLQVLREFKAREAGTPGKRQLADSPDGSGQDNVRQRRAIVEGFLADGTDAVRHDDFAARAVIALQNMIFEREQFAFSHRFLRLAHP